MARVGGEVDAFCTRCGLLLAHTVHAMVGQRPVRVECNTCHAVHAWRSPPGASSAAATRAPRARTRTLSFDDLLRSRDLARAAPYSPQGRFALDQVIEHPVFGTGLVTALKDGGKLEVTFRSAVRVLVHGKA
ncbi:MAG TPA: hypothetical protein VH880_14825 [Anaeromyxobacteraceae bacterium]|jgi:hypothetical protein